MFEPLPGPEAFKQRDVTARAFADQYRAQGVVEDIWLVATASLSLSRTGASGDACVSPARMSAETPRTSEAPRLLGRRRSWSARHRRRLRMAELTGDEGERMPVIAANAIRAASHCPRPSRVVGQASNNHMNIAGQIWLIFYR